MRSSNPAFKDNAFSGAAQGWRGEVMTLDGTALKTGVLGILVVLSAAWPWHLFFSSHISTAELTPYWLGGSLSAFVVAMLTIWKKNYSPVTAPLYAVLEGLTLGAISVLYEYKYPGVAIQAVGLTFAVLGGMLFLYTSHLVRPSVGFMKTVAMATLGVAVYYVIAMLMSCFGVHAPMIWDTGIIGIGFSVLVSILASLNLLLDFSFIDSNVQSGAPKYMEWYGAFGIMVTTVWLYLELLRLMSKLNRK